MDMSKSKIAQELVLYAKSNYDIPEFITNKLLEDDTFVFLFLKSLPKRKITQILSKYTHEKISQYIFTFYKNVYQQKEIDHNEALQKLLYLLKKNFRKTTFDEAFIEKIKQIRKKAYDAVRHSKKTI